MKLQNAHKIRKTTGQGNRNNIIFVSWTHVVLLSLVVVLALLVVYSTHESRIRSATVSQLNADILEQEINHDQLMLEEGTFARTATIERKAREALQLQNISLEQVVRVTP